MRALYAHKGEFRWFIYNTFNMTHPNKPLTWRVGIHHQNAKWAQTNKRCTLKKGILIFGYVKNGQQWSQKIELKENGLRKKQRKHSY